MFRKSIAAGAAIGLGGAAFLLTENRLVASLLFAVGLFSVCTGGLALFTGKACFVLKDWNIRVLPLIFLGNLVGAAGMAVILLGTRYADAAYAKACSICATKATDTLLSLFDLGVLCNMCIYVAVKGYRHNPHEIGKYLSIIFGVVVFVYCGFEHCIADMFYILVVLIRGGFNAIGPLDIVRILSAVTIGNICGALLPQI